jgi:hypothetical protein
MRKIAKIVLVCLAISGCVSAEKLAAIDDAKCKSYGSQPGDPAYVTCRSQLDAARTQAIATSAAAGGIKPIITQ